MDLTNITWNNKNYKTFINYLQEISEPNYKEFHSKITPTKYEILGIRLPQLRKISKHIFSGDYTKFLNIKEEKYYEIIMLKGLVISKITNIETLMFYFYDYLNLIDNWALCDSFCNSLKIINKNQEYFLNIIKDLVKSSKVYYVRVGLVLLLNYYVKKEYLKDIFNILNNIKSNEYYLNMAEAWLICECFIKYEKETLNFLANNKLNKFTINKSISKIRDSYRVSKEMKNYLLKYKM